MQEIISEIENLVQEFENPFLEKMFGYISQGKMLRSSLVLAIAGKTEQSIRLCAIVELIQLASLLHDDVIDESSMRRGKSSINSIFENKSAIMLGDALYAKAFFHLSSFPAPIAQSLSHSVCQLSSGEIYDVFLSQAFNPSKEKYFLMIEQKTASLIASSAECAAILANLEREEYFHYGKCLGLAFQIIDDILDLTQSQEVLGKPSMSDFREGKTTLPYLFLFESLDLEDKERLQSLCAKNLSTKEENWIREKMKEKGSIEKSKHFAHKIAKDSLSMFKNPCNPKLISIIDSMLERSF